MAGFGIDYFSVEKRVVFSNSILSVQCVLKSELDTLRIEKRREKGILLSFYLIISIHELQIVSQTHNAKQRIRKLFKYYMVQM